MKKDKKSKYILLILILILICIFAYSHLNSYTLSKKVDDAVENISIVNMEIYDISNKLNELDYEVELVEEEINTDGIEETIYKINAQKKDEIIHIKYNKSSNSWIYTFENTEMSITPLINNIAWGDSLEDLKSKLNVNYFNTRFNSRKLGIMRTYVIYGDSGITLIKPEYGNWSYELLINGNGDFYKLEILR